jgi:hypothetical protein
MILKNIFLNENGIAEIDNKPDMVMADLVNDYINIKYVDASTLQIVAGTALYHYSTNDNINYIYFDADTDLNITGSAGSYKLYMAIDDSNGTISFGFDQNTYTYNNVKKGYYNGNNKLVGFVDLSGTDTINASTVSVLSMRQRYSSWSSTTPPNIPTNLDTL